jgi:predicted enzyme related to lactoylglutathione lyase
MTDRKQLPGKFVWFELRTREVEKAQAFYGEVLGWKVRPFPLGDQTYEMIDAGEVMIGGYAPPPEAEPSRWLSYVSVEDVDAAARAAAANGGRVLDPPSAIPGVGRGARIADPQGAELWVMRNDRGDPPDTLAPAGHFFWNELHTPAPAEALAFYAQVVGLAHRSLPAGPGGAYHIVSRDGVDRGGATHHMPPGTPADWLPHWLPYVHVDDADATLARARKQGGTVVFGAEDIPGIGRFGVLRDPTGASLAVMKPMPQMKK